jgi:hypothetical protein
MVQRVPLGSEGLGAAWVLVLLGPLGWLVLVVLAVTRSPAEVLRVELPMSEAAYFREVRARRSYHLGCVLAALGAVAVLVAITTPWNGSPALGLLFAVLAVTIPVGGIVHAALSHRRLVQASVDIELDASRRWVYLWRVHPDFAAEAERHASDMVRTRT